MHEIPIKDVLHDHQDQDVVNEQMQLALDQEKEDHMANKYNNEKFIVGRQLHAKWITSRTDALMLIWILICVARFCLPRKMSLGSAIAIGRWRKTVYLCYR